MYGVGGDSVLTPRNGGPFADDEAFKKAYTDAMSNAMKQIGMGADVHMGQHDDCKYVSEVNKQLHQDTNTPTNGALKVQQSNVSKHDWAGPLTRTKLSEELRRLRREFQDAFDNGDIDAFMALKNNTDTKAVIKQAIVDMPVEWAGPMQDGEPYKDMFAALEKGLRECNPMMAG